jgi:hypothetical protein
MKIPMLFKRLNPRVALEILFGKTRIHLFFVQPSGNLLSFTISTILFSIRITENKGYRFSCGFD